MAISDKLDQVGAPEQQYSEKDSVIEDWGDDGRSWLYNFLEMDGGIGGVQLSGFGASKKRRLSTSRQGCGVDGGSLHVRYVWSDQ
jgi:hypothetical protein